VRVPTEYHVAVVQLLAMEDGTELLRFCWYDHRGRFHRQPLIADRSTWIEILARSETDAPRLYQLLHDPDGAAASVPLA
jgi:hypothetical protein